MRSVLRWLDDPHGFRARPDDARWAAFVQQCKADYGFDPTVDGEVSAARKLGTRQASLGEGLEAVRRNSRALSRRRRAAPQSAPRGAIVRANLDAWPQDNEMAEDQLRSRLRDFSVLTPEGARKEATQLDGEHGWRRGTVWADLDHAPLAFAVEQLVALARAEPLHPLASDDLDSLVSDYAERGWRADDAVLRAWRLHRAARIERRCRRRPPRCTRLARRWRQGTSGRQSGRWQMPHTYQAGQPASKAPGSHRVRRRSAPRCRHTE